MFHSSLHPWYLLQSTWHIRKQPIYVGFKNERGRMKKIICTLETENVAYFVWKEGMNKKLVKGQTAKIFRA